MSLESEFERKTGLKLGKGLSQARRVIFELKDYPGRVVKIDSSSINGTNQLMRLLDRINRLRVTPTVKVYQYGRLDGRYYYVMNKLLPITHAEFNSFSKLVSKYSSGNIYSPDFNWRNPKLSNKLRLFFYQAKALHDKYGYFYQDLHEGNIMKTPKGEFKFIDLESFTWNYKR